MGIEQFRIEFTAILQSHLCHGTVARVNCFDLGVGIDFNAAREATERPDLAALRLRKSAGF